MKLVISSVFVATVLECGVSGLTLTRSHLDRPEHDKYNMKDLSEHQNKVLEFEREMEEAQKIKNEADRLKKEIADKKAAAAAEASAYAYLAGRDAAYIADAAASSASANANKAITAARKAKISEDFRKLRPRNDTSRSMTRRKKMKYPFYYEKKALLPSENSRWEKKMNSLTLYPEKLSAKRVGFAKEVVSNTVFYVTSGLPSKTLEVDVAAEEEEEEELPPGYYYDEKENSVTFDSSRISRAVQEDHSTSPLAKNTTPTGILNRNSARAAADLKYLKYSNKVSPFLKTMITGFEIDGKGTVFKLDTDNDTNSARFVVKRKVSTHWWRKATMRIESIDVSDVKSIWSDKNENEEYYTLNLSIGQRGSAAKTMRCKTNISDPLTIGGISSGLENIIAIYKEMTYVRTLHRLDRDDYAQKFVERDDGLFSTWITALEKDLLSESKNTAAISEAEKGTDSEVIPGFMGSDFTMLTRVN